MGRVRRGGLAMKSLLHIAADMCIGAWLAMTAKPEGEPVPMRRRDWIMVAMVSTAFGIAAVMVGLMLTLPK